MNLIPRSNSFVEQSRALIEGFRLESLSTRQYQYIVSEKEGIIPDLVSPIDPPFDLSTLDEWDNVFLQFDHTDPEGAGHFGERDGLEGCEV